VNRKYISVYCSTRNEPDYADLENASDGDVNCMYSLNLPFNLLNSTENLITLIFFSIPPHVHTDLVVPPPGCGRSVPDFWSWGSHRAQLHCPDDVSDDIYELGVPGGALNLSSTGHPDHGRYVDLPLQGKIPTAEAGIEPGTSLLIVRSSDHQATRLVSYTHVVADNFKNSIINTAYTYNKESPAISVAQF
jgi:hypothetical protein